nr:class I SAM-dependent methyltransferase [Phytoactinopolyspora alkaliphila]
MPEERFARRAEFLQRLAEDGRTSVLEVGSGPGRDGHAFVTAGLSYRGVDLSPGQVAEARALGLDVHVASALDLPFADDSFDAAWTMSTLMHLTPPDLPSALDEITRVLRPGGLVAIGVWGADTDQENAWNDGSGFGPARYFNLLSDSTLKNTLQEYGTLEDWRTWSENDEHHYQWALLRTPRSP